MISPFKRLELFFWAMLPTMLTALLLIVVLAPKHIGGLSSVMPLLPLMPVFYWGMKYERGMPYWVVFAAGLITDAATGLPLGLSSLMYMLFLALLRAQRKYIHKEGFIIKWGYFSVLLLAVCVTNWVVLSLFASAAQNVSPALIQWLLTVCCYPLFHAAFDAIYSGMSDRRWRILHS